MPLKPIKYKSRLENIKTDPEKAIKYCWSKIGGRWPEAEPYIMKDPKHAVSYASYIIGGRWPEAEPYIIKDAQIAFEYVMRVFKGKRWPDAEPIIKQTHNWPYYKKLFNLPDEI